MPLSYMPAVVAANASCRRLVLASRGRVERARHGLESAKEYAIAGKPRCGVEGIRVADGPSKGAALARAALRDGHPLADVWYGSRRRCRADGHARAGEARAREPGSRRAALHARGPGRPAPEVARPLGGPPRAAARGALGGAFRTRAAILDLKIDDRKTDLTPGGILSSFSLESGVGPFHRKYSPPNSASKGV
jgi:hypothetical protein